MIEIDTLAELIKSTILYTKFIYFVEECFRSDGGRFLIIPYNYCEAAYEVASGSKHTCAPIFWELDICGCGTNDEVYTCSLPQRSNS